MPRRRPPLGDPSLAVAYLRVSTEEQRLGPEAQREAIGAWAARAGVVVAAWHTDQGVSGSAEVEDRPGLGAALADLSARKAGLFVVARRDRIARDAGIAALVERAVGRAWARIVSADGSGNGTEASDQLMRSVTDAFAAFELAQIRARTRAALRAKRARGERAGNVPWGYQADAAGRLTPHEGERETLARMKALRTEGETLEGIAEALADEGRLNRRGRPFDLATVSKALRSDSV